MLGGKHQSWSVAPSDSHLQEDKLVAPRRHHNPEYSLAIAHISPHQQSVWSLLLRDSSPCNMQSPASSSEIHNMETIWVRVKPIRSRFLHLTFRVCKIREGFSPVRAVDLQCLRRSWAGCCLTPSPSFPCPPTSSTLQYRSMSPVATQVSQAFHYLKPKNLPTSSPQYTSARPPEITAFTVWFQKNFNMNATQGFPQGP